MHRCLELARLGAGHVAPNPMVGAVLVHEGRIIGEGYHRLYGQAHAEVNCIASVSEEDRRLIPQSTIYVSLEPCAHFGKTPPCADLIIRERIPRVVVGCRDPFPQVDGKGIEKMRAAGISVEVGVLEKECVDLNKRFFVFNIYHRPYIVLKWAQSMNGRISGGGKDRVLISNEYTNRLVHKWRGEEAAILVGTNTALMDDPSLTVRLWKGPNPIRLVMDRDLSLPSSLRVFDGQVRTVVFNLMRHEERGNLQYYQLAGDSSLVHQLAVALYQLKISSVLVEGGAAVLQSFIDEGYWDEARIITNETLQLPDGLASPVLSGEELVSQQRLFSDVISYYRPRNIAGAGHL
ncbi:MAG: bifunctional diaminohydroxyphosphoribosylaminopyrimidine deaminase/5-amino-6-(5-phosphoribosylamino)uracil reductase RibD [Chitinophagaceae bacterium]|nr:bifunctional diaminohydroxyphosphoribosylaminopyrimidine deaminase/5-amino-6-(5-phosphoribosylamino)uracil reductase RibD [Chitinophagaceae bacterium]